MDFKSNFDLQDIHAAMVRALGRFTGMGGLKQASRSAIAQTLRDYRNVMEPLYLERPDLREKGREAGLHQAYMAQLTFPHDVMRQTRRQLAEARREHAEAKAANDAWRPHPQIVEQGGDDCSGDQLEHEYDVACKRLAALEALVKAYEL